ncbi:hypothetical protein FKG94_17320 [Exilibacterium tricleocarpae]|uniref:Bacterial transcriptional activator domain-containing protein n=1 Tax=Exilibacterium tricleocarpae TaxID=2591008 RepID=A0A545T8B1_9GAMM|nr:bacterial transcriptional activator domain-containing protein [Exilibacterium tricleocarpae]TQV73462.1 hypothetical protein FKG94_17320 [Exilibacterium tricleocarpae]
MAPTRFLWPEADENIARARLRRTLHRLRALLDTEAIQADRDRLQISARVHIDADTRVFEQACERGNFRRAIELYRADFLAGFTIPDSEELEEWLFFRRETLRGKLRQALERLHKQQYCDGDYTAAVATANALVDLNPLNETAHFTASTTVSTNSKRMWIGLSAFWMKIFSVPRRSNRSVRQQGRCRGQKRFFCICLLHCGSLF